jgi:hypothetical protein
MRTRMIIGTLALALASTAAHADSTCTQLISNVNATLNSQGGYYDFEMTMHRTDVGLVTYSSGALWKNGSNPAWPLVGTSNQLFSDRRSGNQPFNFNAADQLTPYISPSGALYIYYNTWRFSTQWDMSCVGNTLTKIVPGFGVVSLTFRSWRPPIG